MNKELLQQALDALIIAEAGLADIGDADREPGDDLAWCEARAAQSLASPRNAIIALRAALAAPRQQPVPLTDEQIFTLDCICVESGDHGNDFWISPYSVEKFARAIESAHGIGSEGGA